MSARQRKAKTQQKTATSSSTSLVSGTITPSSVSEEGHEETTSTTRRTATRRQATSSRTRSPSPLNISRQEEKEEIAHLNDRLASYIDYVRNLEQTTQQLTRRLTSQTESQQIDVSGIRDQYQSELTSLRKALDDISSQKAKAEMGQKRADADLQEALRNKREAEDRANHLSSKVDQLQKQLEKETLARTKLENRIQSLQEEVGFQSRVHEEEISQLKKTTVTEVEEKIISASQNEYKSRLAEELRALRAETAEELEKYRSQLESDFNSQFEALQSTRENQAEEVSLLRQESKRYQQQWESSQAELNLLRSRCTRLEKDIENQREQHESEMKRMRETDQKLRDELEEKMREFAELMAVKIALDHEIMAYRKLLEGEESRLNIPLIAKESSFSSIGRSSTAGSKRRRVDLDEGEERESYGESHYVARSRGSGLVHIEEADTENGKFIRLISRSDDDVHMANWHLKYKVDGKEHSYKFARSIILKPGDSMTLWSSDSGETHDPPANVVMKGIKLVPGKRIDISLEDDEGDEQAGMEATREQMTEQRARLSGGRVVRRRAVAGDSDGEKCALM